MLQSRMIRYRRSLAYNNSNTAHINEVLLNGDLAEHKGLLFAIGYTRYTSYFEKIIRSSDVNEITRSHLVDIYDELFDDLTLEERKTLDCTLSPLT